jgi:hypothetical protein
MLIEDPLQAEAPPAVIALIAQGSSDTIIQSKMTKSDKQSLAAAIEVLQARLAAAGEYSDEANPSELSVHPVAAEESTSSVTKNENTTGQDHNDDEMLL